MTYTSPPTEKRCTLGPRLPLVVLHALICVLLYLDLDGSFNTMGMIIFSFSQLLQPVVGQ